MDIFKVVGLGLAAATLAVFVKGWKPEIAIGISLAASAIIFIAVMPYLKSVIAMIQNLSEQVGIEGRYIRIVLKVSGIAYIAQFGAELCRDAGETSVASKIEFAGKLMIMALSMPLVYKLLEIVNDIIHFG
ncbi:MAG: stage III sporulation protein AD [Clostridia bacterium]|nr:stage III sporulation protein AD [Clostridia bacterium]